MLLIDFDSSVGRMTAETRFLRAVSGYRMADQKRNGDNVE
jgi:hypothetical protein